MRVLERAVQVFVVAYVGALVLLVTYALLARFVLHGPVTGPSLAVSVGREAGSPGRLLGDAGECKAIRAGRTWTCNIPDRQGSGAAVYRIRPRPESSCWTAELTQNGSEGGMPDALSGCVYRWQWSLLS